MDGNNTNPNPPANNNSAADPRQQIIEKLKQSNNVLVTVSSNPSIDQLAACIGLTLLVNKLNKHGTAVFSGEVPSTIEFLKPEDTLEKNTDSLRDFIIALDKSKADKLRYKVEDKVVKIFITPYRASLSDQDLDFSYGDFNVDVVIALGVHKQQDLDEAITAHGRILHDATIISINNTSNGDLGNINWSDESASSLSEMVAGIDGELGKDVVDGQIATAFLTGIVAETDRFSNKKTTPKTMSVSAKLMTAGANQQLVVSKLEEPRPEPPAPPAPPIEPPKPPEPTEPPTLPADEVPPQPEEEKPKPNDGSLQISHDEDAKSAEPGESQKTESQIEIDQDGNLLAGNDKKTEASSSVTGGTPIISEPPTYDEKITANIEQEGLDPSTDMLSSPLPTPTMNWSEPKQINPPSESEPSMPEQRLPNVSESHEEANNSPMPELGNIETPGPGLPTSSPLPAPGLDEALLLPPQPPIPNVVPESRPQVAGPPSSIPGAFPPGGLTPMDMPKLGGPGSAPGPIDDEEKPSGTPSSPTGPPPPPVPPPPPTSSSLF